MPPEQKKTNKKLRPRHPAIQHPNEDGASVSVHPSIIRFLSWQALRQVARPADRSSR